MAAKIFLVVAYDISSNRKRKKVSDILEEYGLRINKSVFEVKATASEIKTIKAGIGKLIKKKSDSVLFYYLCRECILKNEYLGTIVPQTPTVQVV